MGPNLGGPNPLCQDLKKHVIPANTQKSTSLAVNLWIEWSSHRRAVNPSDWPAHLLIMSECELNRWLSLFVLETMEKNIHRTRSIKIEYAVVFCVTFGSLKLCWISFVMLPLLVFANLSTLNKATESFWTGSEY